MPADESLLGSREAGQLTLLDVEQAAVTAAQVHHEYTGERLFSQRPETYSAIVQLSAAGLGALLIAELLHVAPATVLRVRDREQVPVEIEKTRLSKLARGIASLTLERILEIVSDEKRCQKVSVKDWGILFGILAEKSQLFSGGPTGRTEIVDGEPGQEQVVRYLQKLRDAWRMSSGGGMGGAKGALPAAAGAAPGPAEAAASVAGVAPGPEEAADGGPAGRGEAVAGEGMAAGGTEDRGATAAVEAKETEP
jgi:hypothetical protein